MDGIDSLTYRNNVDPFPNELRRTHNTPWMHTIATMITEIDIILYGRVNNYV